MIKDLGKLKYFLGIEVIETNSRVCSNQRKYCLELLNEFGYLGCKPLNTPMEVNLSFKHGTNPKQLANIYVYQKLIGKLIYLTLTRPDISFTVHALSQYMHAPTQFHLNLAFRVLRYLKLAPGTCVHLTKR